MGAGLVKDKLVDLIHLVDELRPSRQLIGSPFIADDTLYSPVLKQLSSFIADLAAQVHIPPSLSSVSLPTEGLVTVSQRPLTLPWPQLAELLGKGGDHLRKPLAL